MRTRISATEARPARTGIPIRPGARRPRLAAGLLLGATLLLLSSVALAQVSPGHDLSWHVVAGGGQKVASAGHAVQSTVGQFAIGPGASTHTLGSGYWYGILRAAGPISYGVYLPLVFRNWPPGTSSKRGKIVVHW